MLTVAAVLALVLAYFALVAAYLAMRTLARLRRATAVLNAGGDERETMVEATERHIMLTAAVAEQMAVLRSDIDSIRSDAATAESLRMAQASMAEQLDRVEADALRGLRNVALVRFDAFDEMAGRLSFALAVLDDRGDGVTLSALAGRADTRLFAKGVHGGVGEHELSPEERSAVEAALGGRSATRKIQRKAS